jgi:hypothetical protein
LPDNYPKNDRKMRITLRAGSILFPARLRSAKRVTSSAEAAWLRRLEVRQNAGNRELSGVFYPEIAE